MSRLNFAKLSKHLLELIVVSAIWQTLHEEVQEAALLAWSLIASLMLKDFDGLAIELELS